LLGLSVDVAEHDSVTYSEVLDKYRMFVLHRVPHARELEQFIGRARALQKPVIFDTGDLIFDESLISRQLAASSTRRSAPPTPSWGCTKPIRNARLITTHHYGQAAKT